MATVTDIINYAKGLANAHTGVDIDGAYGMQCVDLPNAISQKFFGKLYGVTLLTSSILLEVLGILYSLQVILVRAMYL